MAIRPAYDMAEVKARYQQAVTKLFKSAANGTGCDLTAEETETLAALLMSFEAAEQEGEQ
jgi:hypothetical protein